MRTAHSPPVQKGNNRIEPKGKSLYLRCIFINQLRARIRSKQKIDVDRPDLIKWSGFGRYANRTIQDQPLVSEVVHAYSVVLFGRRCGKCMAFVPSTNGPAERGGQKRKKITPLKEFQANIAYFALLQARNSQRNAEGCARHSTTMLKDFLMICSTISSGQVTYVNF